MFDTEDLQKLINIETEIRTLEKKRANIQADCERIKEESAKMKREAEQEIELKNSTANQELNLRKQLIDQAEQAVNEREKTVQRREVEVDQLIQQAEAVEKQKEILNEERVNLEGEKKSVSEKENLVRLEIAQKETALYEREQACAKTESELKTKIQEVSIKESMYDSVVKDRENLNKEIEAFNQYKSQEQGKLSELRLEGEKKLEEANLSIRNTEERLKQLEEEYKKKMKG